MLIEIWFAPHSLVRGLSLTSALTYIARALYATLQQACQTVGAAPLLIAPKLNSKFLMCDPVVTKLLTLPLRPWLHIWITPSINKKRLLIIVYSDFKNHPSINKLVQNTIQFICEGKKFIKKYSKGSITIRYSYLLT